MKAVSDLLAQVAADLDMEYVRSFNLTEADYDINHLKSDKPILIYNGPSTITTEYEGAMIMDNYDVELYFITKKTTKDMRGVDIDVLLQEAKRLVDKAYFIINANTAQDVEPYSSEAVAVLTDAYIGLQVTITITLYNAGC